jgi:hypothetical protein
MNRNKSGEACVVTWVFFGHREIDFGNPSKRYEHRLVIMHTSGSRFEVQAADVNLLQKEERKQRLRGVGAQLANLTKPV